MNFLWQTIDSLKFNRIIELADMKKWISNKRDWLVNQEMKNAVAKHLVSSLSLNYLPISNVSFKNDDNYGRMTSIDDYVTSSDN